MGQHGTLGSLLVCHGALGNLWAYHGIVDDLLLQQGMLGRQKRWTGWVSHRRGNLGKLRLCVEHCDKIKAKQFTVN